MQLKAHRKRAVLSLREKLHRGGGDRLPIDAVFIKTDTSKTYSFETRYSCLLKHFGHLKV